MKAIVNNQCDGSGSCVEVCPEVFEMIAAGSARVKVEVVPEEAEAFCRQAQQNCPA